MEWLFGSTADGRVPVEFIFNGRLDERTHLNGLARIDKELHNPWGTVADNAPLKVLVILMFKV